MTSAALSDEFINEGQPKRWPIVLRQLCDILDKQLTDIIPDEQTRWEHCTRSVIAIAAEFGGNEVYVPRGVVLDRQLRDHRIWVQSAQHNWSENQLAQAYNLSERAVRTILAQQLSLRVSRAQGQLFAA